jgi:isorenieratene synthase
MLAWGPEVLPQRGKLERVTRPTTALIVGGGLAGVSAALTLQERGVATTIVEAESTLGGRLGAWSERLVTGESIEMSRGFHAFFRQYYNLRGLLRRVDPELRMLTPLPDYPVIGAHGAVETFRGLPTRPPFNVIELTRRTPHLGWRDLLRVNVPAALAMLSFDLEATYARYDGLNASAYLDSLRFPPKARAMLFNVFAHSFFNAEEEMSAAELLMMFHFYFTGNAEGLLFDVLNQPFSTALWQPLAGLLQRQGVELRLGCRATRVGRLGAHRPGHAGGPGEPAFALECGGETLRADMLVLALSVPALQALVERSEDLQQAGLGRAVRALGTTRPFVVWRRFLDRPALPERHGFVGTVERGQLDNISLFDVFEDESRSWARRHRGSVVELHAYAVERGFDEQGLRDELWQATLELYPELRGARVIDERFLVRDDCPSFAPGSHAQRPSVATPFPGLALAGDFVRLPLPSALMERATASGLLAANHLLSAYDVCGAPVYSVPRRGLLAWGRPFPARMPAGVRARTGATS